ncbi:MAG: DUF4254 domain-containing protein [Spirosomataceae bacterium]
MQAHEIYQLFKQTISLYHSAESPKEILSTSSEMNKFSQLLLSKNWIDCLQWHLEDRIRVPELPVQEFIQTKREIDRLNQQRTDTVEEIDVYLFNQFHSVIRQPNATFNSETPAWLLDRMSILQLKIYHFNELIAAPNVTTPREVLQAKHAILLEQEKDLAISYDELTNDLQKGKKYMKLYKQMKMYNDSSLIAPTK